MVAINCVVRIQILTVCRICCLQKKLFAGFTICRKLPRVRESYVVSYLPSYWQHVTVPMDRWAFVPSLNSIK